MASCRATKPAWASAIAHDAHGWFAEFAIAGISQRWRWLAPGNFRMGSPPAEIGRQTDETLHQVTLSRAFWLAETACTQAFWQVLCASNPSRFEDPHKPVDSVSWHDVQLFIATLNRRVPGLLARLPSEAEWEYACRAASTGAFSGGDIITPETANYDGNYPCGSAGKGVKGLYRGRTLPVAALPANPWGLHEMHGNVSEWCADWYGAYASEPCSDPRGPAIGDERVLRGGSWILHGRYARCASRRSNEPRIRYSSIGFRLAASA